MLVYRLGWIGILIMGLIVLFSVAEALVGKLAASCQVEVNKQKDERMRACIELLEGAKLIKLHGWEAVFQDRIQAIREKEVQGYIKLKLVKSVDQIVALFAPYISAFLCFWIIAGSEPDRLSSVAIIAALQPILLLVGFFKHFSKAISTVFQMDIVLDRFASIMNAPNVRL